MIYIVKLLMIARAARKRYFEKIPKGKDVLCGTSRGTGFRIFFITRMLAVLRTFTMDEMHREIEGLKGQLKEVREEQMRRGGRVESVHDRVYLGTGGIVHPLDYRQQYAQIDMKP